MDLKALLSSSDHAAAISNATVSTDGSVNDVKAACLSVEEGSKDLYGKLSVGDNDFEESLPDSFVEGSYVRFDEDRILFFVSESWLFFLVSDAALHRLANFLAHLCLLTVRLLVIEIEEHATPAELVDHDGSLCSLSVCFGVAPCRALLFDDLVKDVDVVHSSLSKLIVFSVVPADLGFLVDLFKSTVQLCVGLLRTLPHHPMLTLGDF